MIYINNKYRINQDSFCFILQNKGKDKDGNPTWLNVGYYTKLENALNKCIEIQYKKKLSVKDYSLEEAIKELKEVRSSVLDNIEVVDK